MLDIESLQPKSDSLADLEAAIAAVTEAAAAIGRQVSDYTTRRPALLLSGTTAEIVAGDAQLAESSIERERLAALRAAIEAQLPAARQAAEIDRVRALVEASNAALAEVNAATGRYAAAAAVIAEFAALDRARAVATQRAGYAATMAKMEYPGAEIAFPLQSPAQYADLIQLPGLADHGDGPVEAAKKRFWPEPYVPAPAAPPAPPKAYPPARFTGQAVPTSYEVRQPGTPAPRVAQWGLTPDWGAHDAD